MQDLYHQPYYLYLDLCVWMLGGRQGQDPCYVKTNKSTNNATQLLTTYSKTQIGSALADKKQAFGGAPFSGVYIR